jgi:Ca2+-binding EF-hand superfamily protein
MSKSNIMKPITNVVALSSLASLLFFGVATQTAFAETAVHNKDMLAANTVDPDFKKLDVDKDHKISLKEAAADKVLSVNFDVVDANKDGYVSAEEHASYKASLAAATTEGATTAPNPVN